MYEAGGLRCVGISGRATAQLISSNSCGLVDSVRTSPCCRHRHSFGPDSCETSFRRSDGFDMPAAAPQAVYAEVGQVASVRRVPTVATELIGSGIMEWSRERDRYLNVSEGAVRAPDVLTLTCGLHTLQHRAIPSCSVFEWYAISLVRLWCSSKAETSGSL